MVRDYLKDNFQLAVNGKDFPYDYLGHEVEGDILYCYVEAIKVKKLKKIRGQNRILHELYDDQTNLVHVNNGNGIKSLKLDRGSDTDELVYNWNVLRISAIYKLEVEFLIFKWLTNEEEIMIIHLANLENGI